ncbi:MAG: hypothetical protein K8T91_20255 [Planctomycetes bacterium]|nr:hypothetical protein [Planctomycetota bacterium]
MRRFYNRPATKVGIAQGLLILLTNIAAQRRIKGSEGFCRGAQSLHPAAAEAKSRLNFSNSSGTRTMFAPDRQGCRWALLADASLRL